MFQKKRKDCFWPNSHMDNRLETPKVIQLGKHATHLLYQIITWLSALVIVSINGNSSFLQKNTQAIVRQILQKRKYTYDKQVNINRYWDTIQVQSNCHNKPAFFSLCLFHYIDILTISIHTSMALTLWSLMVTTIIPVNKSSQSSPTLACITSFYSIGNFDKSLG